MLRAITGDTPADVRDRALLAFGMAKRAAPVGAGGAHHRGPGARPDGTQVPVVHSKTGQEGRGMVIAVPDGRRLSPMPHLETLLARTGLCKRTVFRASSMAGSAPR